MANSAQARKRIRQTNVRRAHLRSQRSRVRTVVKKQLQEIADGTAKDISTMQSVLDTASRKRIISRNVARRLKSRLNARIVAQAAAQ